MPKSSTPNLSIKAQIPLDGTSKNKTAKIKHAKIQNRELSEFLTSLVEVESDVLDRRNNKERARYIKIKLVKNQQNLG